MASGDRIPITGVKSVQRGETRFSNTSNRVERVTISRVNLDKALLVFSTRMDKGDAYANSAHTFSVSGELSGSSIEFKVGRITPSNEVNILWQVIEYN